MLVRGPHPQHSCAGERRAHFGPPELETARQQLLPQGKHSFPYRGSLLTVAYDDIIHDFFFFTPTKLKALRLMKYPRSK